MMYLFSRSFDIKNFQVCTILCYHMKQFIRAKTGNLKNAKEATLRKTSQTLDDFVLRLHELVGIITSNRTQTLFT
jgi:hypothetical protein